MGARDLQFRFFLASADDPEAVDEVFSFDVNGTWRWRNEFTFKESSEDPVPLEQIRAVWELSGLAQLSADNTPGGGWTALREAFSVFHRRGGTFPQKLQIVRNPGVEEVVELTLGPDVWEDFRVDEMSGEPVFELAPDATHRTAFPIFMAVSAVQRFEEGAGGANPTGIVQWEQRADHTFEAGLQRITWETTVTTKKGVDAVAKALAFGLIPIAALGSRYTYRTNGPDGVDWEILDADQRSSGEPSLDPTRVPTKVRAVCVVQEWAVDVGVTAPGTGPDSVSLVEETEETDQEKIRRVAAEAMGPGAETWVRRQAPVGDFDEKVTEGVSGRTFKIEWTLKEKSDKAELARVIDGEITGGDIDMEWEPVNGFEPLGFEGPLQMWELTLSVEVTRRGGTGFMSELPFPALLPEPWRLNRKRSSEKEPYEAEAASSPEKVKWMRTARLVYESPSPPSEAPVAWLRKHVDKTVPSYWLGRS